jgi:DNA repair protein RecO
LEKQKVYNTIVNTTENLTEYKQKDLLMWELLKTTIENLNTNNWKIIEIDFLAKFLKVLGFSPNIEYCINCQKKIKTEMNIFFDNERWGFCCEKCKASKSEKITLQTFKSLTLLLTLNLKEICEKKLEDSILIQYQNIKTLLSKYLKQIKKYF